MVDRSITFEQRIGAKWIRVVWPQEAAEPEVRWLLTPNGTPGPGMEIDVRAGARRVQVSWPSGKWEAKVRFWDYDAQELYAAEYKSNPSRNSDVVYDVPASGEK